MRKQIFLLFYLLSFTFYPILIPFFMCYIYKYVITDLTLSSPDQRVVCRNLRKADAGTGGGVAAHRAG